jgi:uncharacterized protein (TIGR02246 family)
MRQLVTAAVVLAAACATTPAGPDVAADEAAIRDLIRLTEESNNAADSVAWVSYFEDGAVYMAPGMPAVTTAAGLREVASAGFGGYAAAVKISPLEVVIMGDWAFARSVVSGKVTPRAGGDDIPVDVKQLVLYRRQADGGWKIARFVSNANS